MAKLQEQCRAGTSSIATERARSATAGSMTYEIVRYRRRDRMQVYRRVFGYTAPAGATARPNAQFHGLFRNFIEQTARYWRDKRISELIRERAQDPR